MEEIIPFNPKANPTHTRVSIEPLNHTQTHITAHMSAQKFNGLGTANQISSINWIFDCEATDTMTYDSRDLLFLGEASRSYVQTANGACVMVDHTGPVDITPSLRLKKCLLIPILSHKL